MAERSETRSSELRAMAHPLAGSKFRFAFKAFRRNGKPIDQFADLGKRILKSTLLKAPFTAIERMRFAPKKRQAATMLPPIFIVGHWRSGTSLLYNILAQSSQFGSVTPEASVLPWDFLTAGRRFRFMMNRALPDTRDVDVYPDGENSIHEDEMALANMTRLSYYHALYFPERFKENFNAGIWFDGVKAKEIADWKKKVQYYYAKLHANNPGVALLIKNPANTARIQALAEMYPDAKFIHIHRNPYEVFYSTREFYRKMFTQFALQTWSRVDIDAHIFATYSRMMEDLDLDWASLDPGNVAEIRLDDLHSSPIEVLLGTFDRLGLTRFHQSLPMFQSYLESVKNHKPAAHNYTEEVLGRIEDNWAMYIRRWHYQRPGGN